MFCVKSSLLFLFIFDTGLKKQLKGDIFWNEWGEEIIGMFSCLYVFCVSGISFFNKVFLLILWEFQTMYFCYIYPHTPTSETPFSFLSSVVPPPPLGSVCADHVLTGGCGFTHGRGWPLVTTPLQTVPLPEAPAGSCPQVGLGSAAASQSTWVQLPRSWVIQGF